jgi:hypothetical protein
MGEVRGMFCMLACEMAFAYERTWGPGTENNLQSNPPETRERERERERERSKKKFEGGGHLSVLVNHALHNPAGFCWRGPRHIYRDGQEAYAACKIGC